jgi:hypothetical protein
MDEIITFKKLVPYGPRPGRASRDLGGTIPARALRYCEAFMSANGFGWYVYPLLPFGLAREGQEVVWTYGDNGEWHYLKSYCHYPHFEAEFDKHAPENIRGFAPTFLAKTVSGMIQIWTGLVVRTAADWSVLVRAPANLPANPAYTVREGIIETDRWVGPLFTNIVLNQDTPVFFDPDTPFLQLQPLQRLQYEDPILSKTAHKRGVDSLTPEEWEAYYGLMVAPSLKPEEHRLGRYATEVRKRRRADAGSS